MEKYYCPITHLVMRDPVSAEDGHIYEKEALKEWVSHKKTSPLTNEPMGGSFHSIHFLRNEINTWLEQNPEYLKDIYLKKITPNTLSEILNKQQYSDLLHYTDFCIKDKLLVYGEETIIINVERITEFPSEVYEVDEDSFEEDYEIDEADIINSYVTVTGVGGNLTESPNSSQSSSEDTIPLNLAELKKNKTKKKDSPKLKKFLSDVNKKLGVKGPSLWKIRDLRHIIKDYGYELKDDLISIIFKSLTPNDYEIYASESLAEIHFINYLLKKKVSQQVMVHIIKNNTHPVEIDFMSTVRMINDNEILKALILTQSIMLNNAQYKDIYKNYADSPEIILAIIKRNQKNKNLLDYICSSCDSKVIDLLINNLEEFNAPAVMIQYLFVNKALTTEHIDQLSDNSVGVKLTKEILENIKQSPMKSCDVLDKIIEKKIDSDTQFLLLTNGDKECVMFLMKKEVDKTFKMKVTKSRRKYLDADYPIERILWLNHELTSDDIKEILNLSGN